MEDPEAEIAEIVHLLTQSPPFTQSKTIETYFTPNASFTHPFCRTGKWENSRFLIQAIYRWYKIMSPRIDITVHSVAFDRPNLLLYVSISQVFRIWIVPFYRAPVKLVTVLELKHNKGDNLYYIDSQNDLYQVDQFVRFIAPVFGKMLVWFWQLWATFFCLLGAAALWPISLLEEYMGSEKQAEAIRRKKRRTANESVEETELRDLDRMIAGLLTVLRQCEDVATYPPRPIGPSPPMTPPPSVKRHRGSPLGSQSPGTIPVE